MDTWIFNGHLGADAESRVLPTGVTVVNFRVALKRGWGDRERTEWVSCAWFGERAAKCAGWLVKGRLVGVMGTPEVAAWQKRDGSGIGAALECRVDRLDFLSSGKATGDEVPATNDVTPRERSAASPAWTDDVPF